ncbi:hypothetical protein HDU76_003250 [Blyttiomyces sp. JEL0837]|nr:hypothetical protein HDU76_003250 [Blyttiomyces sp. JEL0837]
MVNFGTSIIVGLASLAASIVTVQAEIIYLVEHKMSSHGMGPSGYDSYEAWYYRDESKSCQGCNTFPDAIGIIKGVDPDSRSFNPYAQEFTAHFDDGNYATFDLYQPENYDFAPAGTTTTMYHSFNCNIDNGRPLYECNDKLCGGYAKFYCLPAQ